MTVTTGTYESWLKEVEAALASINMAMGDWQKTWAFDFRKEFAAGTSANEGAVKANRFWWYQQNKTINQECEKTPNCWLPRNHQGDCEPCF